MSEMDNQGQFNIIPEDFHAPALVGIEEPEAEEKPVKRRKRRPSDGKRSAGRKRPGERGRRARHGAGDERTDEKRRRHGRRRRGKRRKKKESKAGLIAFILFQILLIAVLIAGSMFFYQKIGKRVLELRKEAKAKVAASDETAFYAEQTSLVYDCEGNLINTLKSDKEVYYLPSEEIPDYVKQAFVSIEDKRFYKHGGYDLKAIIRAAVSYIKKQSITQGGSTITQQLSRNIFLSHTVKWERKVEEIFISIELEKKYSKDKILEFYINNVYFANGYYGIESAARGYFDKSVSELDLSQIAFLCAIPNSPNRYDPKVNLDNTLGRRDRILDEMLTDGVINQNVHDYAVAETIVLNIPETISASNYVQSYSTNCAVKELMKLEGFNFRYDFASDSERSAYDEEYGAMYEECMAKLNKGGYRIYTSLDPKLQDDLQRAIDNKLLGFINKSVEGVYTMQGAATCIDNETGKVVAIVGGRSQDDVATSLNRAYQSNRQPGSTMKPLVVYTPALEDGYTENSIINDHKFADGPENASRTYYGDVTLKKAVELSLNTVAWQVFEKIGVANGVGRLYQLEFAKIMDDDRQTSTALGGLNKGATTVEMAGGYAAIANEGIFRSPTCIVKITDSADNVILDNYESPSKQVYTSDAAHKMTKILEGVIKSGTAKKTTISGITLAGKTGTSNDNKDGWFVGYSHYYTTAVWVGYDQVQSLEGLSGSTYPLDIWQEFMIDAHGGKSNMPLND